MNTKLVSLVLVAVLLGSSLGGILAVTQTKVVVAATGKSAQAAPHFAPLNPAFIKYQQRGSTANVSTSAQAGSGFVPPPIDLSQLKGQSIRSALVGAASLPSSLPSSYDLRTQNKLTPVKDQDGCGDCWAYASYASLESYLLPSETRDFSESNMNNNHGFDIAPCNGGNEFMATAYLARWSGPVNEGSNGPVQKHVQDVYFIPDRGSSTDNDNIKTAITAYGAVYTEMYMDSGSYYSSGPHTYYDPNRVADERLNHAVAIVGWNDNYPASSFAGSPSGNGAWIVKNSWGTGWGDNGYFYVSYYDANIGRYNAVFTAQPTTNYDNIYQYDQLGATGSFGQSSASEWGANIFTANSSENLAAVSFYTFSLSAPYDVYVYTDPTSGPINPSGPAAHVSGSTSLPGYHTIPLASSVSLRAGQKFSVVVKFTSTSSYLDYYYPVPIEAPVSGYSEGATALAGQSYYHADNSNWQQSSTWTDMTSTSPNTNICIKAFTTSGLQVGVVGAPAVCAQGANSLDVFVEGTDGALWWKHWDGTVWSRWESLGGILTSSPAAASPASGKIDVFVRGADGALWQREYSNNAWQSWTSLSGIIYPGTTPAASSWGSGRLDVFVEGMDRALWHQGDNGAWSGWESLGGILTSSPAAASPASGKIDVFVRGADNALWQREYSNNAWQSWTSLGGM
jgi:C1A family cysteine protease